MDSFWYTSFLREPKGSLGGYIPHSPLSPRDALGGSIFYGACSLGLASLARYHTVQNYHLFYCKSSQKALCGAGGYGGCIPQHCAEQGAMGDVSPSIARSRGLWGMYPPLKEDTFV